MSAKQLTRDAGSSRPCLRQEPWPVWMAGYSALRIYGTRQKDLRFAKSILWFVEPLQNSRIVSPQSMRMLFSHVEKTVVPAIYLQCTIPSGPPGTILSFVCLRSLVHVGEIDEGWCACSRGVYHHYYYHYIFPDPGVWKVDPVEHRVT